MTTQKVKINTRVVAPELLVPGMVVLCAAGDWNMDRTAKSADPLDEVFYAEVVTAPQRSQFVTRTVKGARGHLWQYRFTARIAGQVKNVYVPAGHNVPVIGSLTEPSTSTELAGATA